MGNITYVLFSNVIKNNYLEQLAEADEHEVVQQVQEFYADYYAVNTDLFSVNVDTYLLDSESKVAAVDRTADALVSVLLSLKKAPVIRFAKNSELANRIGQEVANRMQKEKGLFDFRRTDSPPVLLILDRRNDPVTPLLTQWTYQAMVHELLGIKNNRVDMRNVPNIRKELQEVVLSTDQDPFYKTNIFNNFGDLGISIKQLVDEFQSKTKNNQNIQSIADMKRFVEEYPEFRKMSGNVSKHVAVMGELSRLIEVRCLLDVSELEQELACKQDHSSAVKKLRAMFDRPEVAKEDLFKLVMLYALRYEENGTELSNFVERLYERGFDAEKIELISALTTYAGAAQRLGDLFENSNFLKIARSSVLRGLKGVNNIYTEHKPLLRSILTSLAAGALKEADFPFILGSPSREKPQDIIVFIVGGATYEEAFSIHELNQDPSFGARIVLGGSTILNSKTFLEELERVRSKIKSSYSAKRRI